MGLNHHIFAKNKKENKIYCWGYNCYQQLGLGDIISRNKPVEFKIEGNSSRIKQIICGESHTFAICENNKVYCCGDNNFGQLGLGHRNDRKNPIEFKIENNSSPIKQIICGSAYAFAICENNQIYCWGENYLGQFGLGYTTSIEFKISEFKIERNASPIKRIICGSDHIFAICENNKIYCWGYNGVGQLGLGDNITKNKPVEFKIEGNSSSIKEIICGGNYTFAICENTKIYCWGDNEYKQLGLGDDKTRKTPVEFKIEENSSPIKKIICGSNHTFAIYKNNKIYCWGNNYFGQLGLSDNDNDRNKPVEFKIERILSPIKQIICGVHYTFAIYENNKIYCCGKNSNGELGLGDYLNRYEPVEFSDGKEKWEFFGEENLNRLEWKEIRFLLIAFYKENKKTCPLATLPKEIIKEISNQETNIIHK